MKTQRGLTAHDGSLPRESGDTLRRFKDSLLHGVEWSQALLEAVSMWTAPEEVYQGRRFRYLIQGEAFDWLLLAERLCLEADGVIDNGQRERLLFFEEFPVMATDTHLRQALSGSKYRAHLNFWYGVIVEEALKLRVENEVCKEFRVKCLPEPDSVDDHVHQRLYGDTQWALLQRFRREQWYPQRKSITLLETREFTYWLFKHRLRICDRARIASDTQKGLRQLQLIQWGATQAISSTAASRDMVY